MKKIHWIIGIAIILTIVIILLWLMKKKPEEVLPDLIGTDDITKTPEEVPPNLIGTDENYIEMFAINSNQAIPFKFWNNVHHQISNASIILSFETPEQSLQNLLDQGVINDIQYESGVEQAHIIWNGSMDLRQMGTVNQMWIHWNGDNVVIEYKNQKGGFGAARFKPFHWQENQYDPDPLLSHIEHMFVNEFINEIQYNNALLQLDQLGHRDL